MTTSASATIAGAPTPTDAGTRPGRAPVFTRDRRIRFSDCDPAAIVFYPQYFVMLNGLVEDWVDAPDEGLGIGYRRLIVERRIGLPTVRLEADFRAVSRLGDTVSLGLAVERLGSRSLTLSLTCHGVQDGEPRMTVRQVLVTTSLDTHRAIEIPADLRAAIERRTVSAAEQARGGSTASPRAPDRTTGSSPAP